MEKERIPLEPRQELELLNVYFWVKLVAEEYADALYICDRMEKLQTTASEDQKKPGLEIELLKILYRILYHQSNNRVRLYENDLFNQMNIRNRNGTLRNAESFSGCMGKKSMLKCLCN